MTDGEAARTFVIVECRACQGVIGVSVWRLWQGPIVCECMPEARSTWWAFEEVARVNRPDLHRDTFLSLRVGRCAGDPPLQRYTLPG